MRRREVEELISDISAARSSLPRTSSPLYAHLSEIRDRAQDLARHTQAPRFLDDYLLVLRDYQRALENLKQSQFSDVEATEELTAPRIYDPTYRPGYGVSGFVPFWAMNSWHASNVAAHEASQSSSSGTNSSFSSGFSGSGGSSSF